MNKEKLKGGAEKLREKRKKAMELEAHKSKNIKFMFEKLAPSSIISQPQPSQELSEKIVSFPEYVSSQVETRIQNDGENQAFTSTALTTPSNGIELVRIVTPHNHASEATRVPVLNILSRMKERARDTEETPALMPKCMAESTIRGITDVIPNKS
ncbi:hypothetical protein RN001_003739 [Aquatica leii]|uniref:Uncharacterized protein n=1 Tax=Aquatica leii TaxID=1421715 RepID=A0AAN7PJ07_9COLE|nr:hypothetical protein RN001_003739 [Aquatica leii]